MPPNNTSDLFYSLFRISNYINFITVVSLLIILTFLFSLNTYHPITIFGQQSNDQLDNKDINTVAVGDFYCNDEKTKFFSESFRPVCYLKHADFKSVIEFFISSGSLEVCF